MNDATVPLKTRVVELLRESGPLFPEQIGERLGLATVTRVVVLEESLRAVLWEMLKDQELGLDDAMRLKL